MHKLLTIAFAFLFKFLLKFICGTNRLTVTRQEIFDAHVEQGNNIFVFWHSRLFYLVYYYIRSGAKRKVSMLVSMSRDGDYGAALVRRLKQDAVRGSTSRGGPLAIRKLVRKLAEGYNIAITPDGPRGPANTVNKGVIRLAQLTGARIIPVSFDATRKSLLKSWDRFVVVKPFGRVHVAFGDPFEVPRHITAAEHRMYAARLERTLRSLDGICADWYGSALSEPQDSSADMVVSTRADVASGQRANVQ